jgi:hypothetical protein
MNAGLPQALVRINIANSAKDTLIEQQRFYARVAAGKPSCKFLEGQFQGLAPQTRGELPNFILANQQYLSKSANIRVAQLAAIL